LPKDSYGSAAPVRCRTERAETWHKAVGPRGRVRAEIGQMLTAGELLVFNFHIVTACCNLGPEPREIFWT
jgi:hypothetical protein